MTRNPFVGILLIALAAWVFFTEGKMDLPSLPDWIRLPSIVAPEQVTAATYVYEKDNGGVPSAVHAALAELNSKGLRATTFEEDTTDGSGEVPSQYRVALAAAREAGLPALVVLAGDKVLRTVKAPKTFEQVTEAAK